MIKNSEKESIIRIRPFLKWAGGKFQIINKIRASLPKGARLIEPFVGSGAVFLNTNYNKFILADINADLINLFEHLKFEKHDFIHFCKQFFTAEFNKKSTFLSLRTEFNSTTDSHLKAALFIYLNRHAFNGLMRYNSSGMFNTAFGDYKKPYFPENEMLRIPEDLITDSGRHLITDSGVFDHFNDSRCGLSFKGV